MLLFFYLQNVLWEILEFGVFSIMKKNDMQSELQLLVIFLKPQIYL